MTTSLTIYGFGLCGNSVDKSTRKHRFRTKKHQKVNKSSQKNDGVFVRVLEAASSSPATSTKKNTDSPYGCLCSSLLCRSGEGSSSPFAHRAKSSSHSKRSREELAHLRRAIGIFSSAENPAIKLKPYANSPTARKYSLLFGGAYAPNDAIYRKRYALRKLLCPTTFFCSGASS